MKHEINTNIPLVAIRVLSYNHEKTISETLDRILTQKCNFQFRIYIGDDFSLDGTREILTEYKKKHPYTIELIFNEQNLGLLKNYKNVTELCIKNSKYIAGCAGDDYWTDPYKLQKQVDFLESNPDYGLCYTDFSILNTRTGKISDSHFARLDKSTLLANPFEGLLIKTFIGSLTVCIRSKIVKDYFDFIGERYFSFVMEDKPLWLFAAKHSKIFFLNESTAMYCKVPNSVSNPKDIEKKIAFIISSYEVSMFYIDCFGANEVIKNQVKLNFYRSIFAHATRFKQKDYARKAYTFLKSKGLLTFKDRLFYLSISSSVLSSLVNIIRQKPIN